MPHFRRWGVVLILALLACSDPVGTSGSGAAPPLLEDLPRGLTSSEAHVSRAANQFALSLFKRINAASPADSNVFVSPLSVTFALGMTMNGANGATFDQMRSTLGFGASELGDINAGYRGLLELEHGLDTSTTFQIANSVWYRQDLPVYQSFKDTVANVFDAAVNASPFDAAAASAINQWVSQNTNGKIQKIVDVIPNDIVMFLINAIYFKGSWRAEFDPAQTQSAPFYALGGQQSVAMMHRPASDSTMLLGEVDGTRVGELFYGNGAFAMTILLPAPATDVNAVASSLDTARWNAAVRTLAPAEQEVFLPKLHLEYKRELKSDLQALGMVAPFSDVAADFTRMSSQGMFIEFVQHKTYVDVDEKGTEAAAVTSVGMGITSVGPPASFRVDRPFIFVIRERFSGTILFIGKIARIPQ